MGAPGTAPSAAADGCRNRIDSARRDVPDKAGSAAEKWHKAGSAMSATLRILHPVVQPVAQTAQMVAAPIERLLTRSNTRKVTPVRTCSLLLPRGQRCYSLNSLLMIAWPLSSSLCGISVESLWNLCGIAPRRGASRCGSFSSALS